MKTWITGSFYSIKILLFALILAFGLNIEDAHSVETEYPIKTECVKNLIEALALKHTPTNLATIQAKLQKGGEQGSGLSYFALGNLYTRTQPGKPELAEYYFEKACQKNLDTACEILLKRQSGSLQKYQEEKRAKEELKVIRDTVEQLHQ